MRVCVYIYIYIYLKNQKIHTFRITQKVKEKKFTKTYIINYGRKISRLIEESYLDQFVTENAIPNPIL